MLRICDNHIPYKIQDYNVDLKKQTQTLAASTSVHLQNTGGNGHITLSDGQLMFRKLCSVRADTAMCERGIQDRLGPVLG